jgi:hypothetical protein
MMSSRRSFCLCRPALWNWQARARLGRVTVTLHDAHMAQGRVPCHAELQMQRQPESCSEPDSIDRCVRGFLRPLPLPGPRPSFRSARAGHCAGVRTQSRRRGAGRGTDGTRYLGCGTRLLHLSPPARAEAAQQHDRVVDDARVAAGRGASWRRHACRGRRAAGSHAHPPSPFAPRELAA